MAYNSGFSNPFGFVVTPMVKRLLIANVAVFFVTAVAGGLAPYLQLSRGTVIPFVWTPISYMFVHVGFFHLLFNMLILFFFGPPLEDRWGSQQFLKFFLLAGLTGGALSLAFPNPIAGASGAIYGVMVAFAMYWPNNPIYFWGIFPIKAKYLVGFLVGIDLFSAVAGRQTNVAHLAHLGGALFAFLYLRSRYAPSQWGAVPQKRSASAGWTQTLASLVKPPPRKPEPPAPVVSSTARRREMHRALDDVDRILDKISEGGISSLTEEERRSLEEASKKFRTS